MAPSRLGRWYGQGPAGGGHLCAAIADCAVDEDGLVGIGQQLLQGGISSIRRHMPGVGQVADGEFVRATDIPDHGGGVVGQQGGGFSWSDVLDIVKFPAQKFPGGRQAIGRKPKPEGKRALSMPQGSANAFPVADWRGRESLIRCRFLSPVDWQLSDKFFHVFLPAIGGQTVHGHGALAFVATFLQDAKGGM